MDYIREELQRQRLALAALLTGQAEGREETETSPAALTLAAERRRTALAPGRMETSAPAGGGGGTEVPISRAVEAWSEGTAFGSRSRQWLAAGAGVGSGALESELAETMSAAAAGSLAGETFRVEHVTEVASPRAPAGASARELSLAFQRDARRYDGGFLPY